VDYETGAASAPTEIDESAFTPQTGHCQSPRSAWESPCAQNEYPESNYWGQQSSAPQEAEEYDGQHWTGSELHRGGQLPYQADLSVPGSSVVAEFYSRTVGGYGDSWHDSTRPREQDNGLPSTSYDDGQSPNGGYYGGGGRHVTWQQRNDPKAELRSEDSVLSSGSETSRWRRKSGGESGARPKLESGKGAGADASPRGKRLSGSSVEKRVSKTGGGGKGGPKAKNAVERAREREKELKEKEEAAGGVKPSRRPAVLMPGERKADPSLYFRKTDRQVGIDVVSRLTL
jgi:hypothetical protein